ncbi:hypothetical protein SAMN05216302_10303 [Nitrosomonas aestuarii]|uniref:Uncharacterized protein n=1 Tax=Nitrosomonas aestuarii TaxID=52441 RepID=A0A1I4ER59_9PROT|nr:hypothetical protein [Nitrosomonas aestuarii]SFL07693.1 hypothetical protein SAMN05216302_10303 [Nitrosomonas aestuarii]
MTLANLIHKNCNPKKIATATAATIATYRGHENATVANVASVAVANAINETINCNTDLDKIATWLFQIGEPEEDHHLVLSKCRNDPDALVYFLKWANKMKNSTDK